MRVASPGCMLRWLSAEVNQHQQILRPTLPKRFVSRLQLIQPRFRLGDDVKTAQDNIPILGDLLRGIHPGTITALSTPAIWGAVVALLAMLIAAAFVISKRVKPE